jgi:hypothetical protein
MVSTAWTGGGAGGATGLGAGGIGSAGGGAVAAAATNFSSIRPSLVVPHNGQTSSRSSTGLEHRKQLHIAPTSAAFVADVSGGPDLLYDARRPVKGNEIWALAL